MLPLYVLSLLLLAAHQTTACKDGVEIKTWETRNPADVMGNWTYIYHWDSLNKFNNEFVTDFTDHKMQCPWISISLITPDYVKAKEAECKNTIEPFNWVNAKLRLDAPLMKMKGAILVIGEKENWLVMECKRMFRVVLKMVSDDYLVMFDPDMASTSEMLARKTPSLEELKCIAHNVDVGKGLSGFCMCV